MIEYVKAHAAYWGVWSLWSILLGVFCHWQVSRIIRAIRERR